MNSRNIKVSLLLLVFFSLAFIYRVYGIFDNHPFWVDEYSTLYQAKLLLKYGLGALTNPLIHIERHNIVVHDLISIFLRFFGAREWVARLPLVLIGSLVPVLVLLVTKKIYDTRTAISAAILTTLSYFQIVWSRQARGYVLVQLLILLTLLLYLKIRQIKPKTNKINKSLYIIAFTFSLVIGFYTHPLYLIFLSALFVETLVFNFKTAIYLTKKIYTYIFLIIVVGLSIKTGLLSNLVQASTPHLFGINNIWYYHSFLWREYGLISFLAIVGFTVSIFTKRRQVSPIIIFAIAHLVFVCYLFPPYTSRYLLPIFPFLLMQASYTIVYFTDLFLKQQKLSHIKTFRNLAAMIVVLFIVLNGDKFVTKPKQFYSVNHDFREIALVDYTSIYNIIKEKGDLNMHKTAVIDTWLDRMYWYVGDDYPALYMFRWIKEPGLINGLAKETSFIFNTEGEKIIPRQKNLRFVGELKDLKKAMKKYPKGFIFIDDASLPKDVIDYAEKNFKKELYLDHYPLDDNPYSIWPATLYSWGIN